jgi:protein-S-isoprenylcysteine O-methyltransferase Ste14
MHLLPTLRLGLANHWVLLIIYAVVLIVCVARLPKDQREWLFSDPKETLHGPRKLLLRFGQLTIIGVLVVLSLTPLLGVPAWLAVVGLSLYAVGTALVAVSIHYFGRTARSEPVTDGPYRFSRNPQWVGLFSALLGMAIASGSWLLVLAVFAVGAVYHIQIVEEEKTCSAKYGRPYEEYLRRVPRYLLVI